MSRVELPPESIPDRAGRLEAVVEVPAVAHSDAVGVICHPHPVYHGTMNNKVVHKVSRAMNRLDRPAVRFRFRGVAERHGEYAHGEG